MDANELVKVYIKIRDAKAAKTAEMEDAIKALQDQMDLVEHELLEICKTTGQDGGKTEHGSFTRSVKTRYWPSDWDAMYRFIKEHDAFSLMFQRINSANMAQFLEEYPDLLPPGLNADVNQTVVITKR